MSSETVKLRHPVAEFDGNSEEENSPLHRRPRPRSASYIALRSAVYQLTSMADFKREKIGAGFFADVYKVVHKTTGEVMVLKVNKSSKTSKSMLTEIQLMNRLSHPNILKFKGSCVHEGHLHALTEYINGGSLEEVLMDETIQLPWSVRLKMIRDISRGMAYLHSRNVFHRDLNPKNCLIQKLCDGKFLTIVADFGLAAMIKQRRRRSHTEIVGSPYWMAPECLNGNSYCEQADVFSFGITLAEIIARIPADPDVMPRTSKFGIDIEAMRNMCKDCPEKLFQLLYNCCEIDPDDRPNFEEILEFLKDIHLEDTDEQGEEDEEGGKYEEEIGEGTVPGVNSHQYSSRDLRGSVSEPLLRTADPEDDNLRSCGSEEKYIIQHRQRHQSSLGSSTGSSCSFVIEEEEDSTLSQGDELNETGRKIDSVAPRGDSLEENGVENDIVINPVIVKVSEGIKPSEDVPVISNDVPNDLERSNSEGNMRNKGGNRRILPIRKNSWRGGGGHDSLQKTSTESGNDGDKHHQYLTPLSTEKKESLDWSTQTLVAGEGEEEKEEGGDSGIDPGVVDVFKYSQLDTPITPIGTMNDEWSCDLGGGDDTPICTSPNFNFAPTSRKDQASISMAKPIDSDIRYNTLQTSSPIHNQRLSCSGTSSDEMADLDLFKTPNGHQSSSSIANESITSSEYSFNLPPPSTSWAPPSSPMPSLSDPLSLPSSPLHSSSHHSRLSKSHRHNHLHHRHSLEITSNSDYQDASCLRKKSSLRPQSCGNSAIFSDFVAGSGDISFQEDLQRKDSTTTMKSVHFLDMDLSYDGSTTGYPSSRTRSKSNPSNELRKHSMDCSLSRHSSSDVEEYSISLKTDFSSDDDTLVCKHYKITQVAHSRLSNSAPDLSKLVISPHPHLRVT